jgi:ActR/RegA family two-component response regulator
MTSAPIASAQTAPTSLADVERDHIGRVLRETNGNITKAAASLGIDRRTLRGYGIDSQ